MAEWYGKASQEGDSEHNRLSRILDVAQDLKALSVLLQTNLFPFVIDLAVLASRREYLNLEKWLTDQLQVCCYSFLEIVIFYYTEILTGKVVLWCFFTSATSEKIHNSTF